MERRHHLPQGPPFRCEPYRGVCLGSILVDANQATASTPAEIASYTVIHLSGDVYLHHVRLIAGVSDLADEKYYSRVFLNGSIEPAPRRTGYAGLSLEC